MSARLSDLCQAIVDCEHKTAPEGDGFALSIGTRGMKHGRLVLELCKPVSEVTYFEWTRRMIPVPGDLVLAREAPVGQVVRVPTGRRICLGQRTVLIRPDATRVHPRFLHYWLLGPDAQGPMTAKSGGATVAHLNVEDIRNLDTSGITQDGRIQHWTASFLGAIDDLIENNVRRVRLLDDMARTIYREWFVAFRYPGRECVPIVDSPVGWIPDGWTVQAIKAVASAERHAVTSGPFGSKLGRADYIDFGVPVLRGANLRVGGGFDESQLVFVSDDKAQELRSSVARPGDVVVTQRGTLGQVGLIPKECRYEKYVLSQSQMKVTVDPQRITPEFLYACLRSREVTERFVAQAMTAGVPHVNLALLRGFRIVVPPFDLQRRYTQVAKDLAGEGHRLVKESAALETIRDILLPRLVTGRIDVSALDLDALAEGPVA